MPETASERSIYVLIHGEQVFNKEIPLKPWPQGQVVEPIAYYTWEIFNSPGLKGIFEAFLFSTDRNSHITTCLGVDENEVAFYRDMFFNTEVFRNDLERTAWLQTIPDEDATKELFKVAFHQGFASLRWNYCRDKGTVSMEEAENTVLTDSYIQYLSHRGKTLNNKTAKEARSLGKVVLEAIKTKRAKDDMGGERETSESLRFKFSEARKTATIDELNKEGIEVMH